MQLTSLFEAGIRTAAIETAARKALRSELPKKVAAFIKTLMPSLRPARYPAGHEEEQSDLIDRLDAFRQDNQELYATKFSSFASDILTDVLRKHLSVICPSIPSLVNYYQYVCGPNWLSDVLEFNKCIVEVRELSKDPSAAGANGYFDSLNGKIKIFTHYEIAQSACGDCMTFELFGEMDGSAFDMFIHNVLATFAHEYAHCEQDLRHAKTVKKSSLKDPGYFRDRTMIVPAVQGGRRTPKRGGEFRHPQRGGLDLLQYNGALHEIDAFASGAASQLVSTISRSAGNQLPEASEFNDHIEIIKHGLIYGYSDSSQFTRYYNMLKSRFDDDIKDLKVKPEDIEKVWKRFVKSVSSKLDDYKMDQTGMIERDKKPFVTYQGIVKGMQPSQAIGQLAEITASATFEDNDVYGDRVMDALKGYGRFVEEMERFIAWQYFKNVSYDPRYTKAREIFRRMVARKISEYEAQTEMKKAA